MVQRLLSKMITKTKNLKLAIIGLGYVGLPLALEFAKKRTVVGYDKNKTRVNNLNLGVDKNLEFTKDKIKSSKQLKFTYNNKDLRSANCYIVTVPTPIDELKKPDLEPLFSASEMIGKILKKKDLVIYESTVYPGCIEEECVPILEKFSRLKFNNDFFCGYSPERINPGDKERTLSNIKKITSGSTTKIADLVDRLYNEIITVGTFKASSIKVAEAAKVIENTQRDLNIALINELSILFHKLNIDTNDVLEAAATKWNFLPFKPGLVGGHCIGVDPYYLTYKAESVGYHPKIILAGRELNDNMGNYLVSELIKKMKNKDIRIKGAKILIMGLTFKENCTDLRNSGVEKVIKELIKFECDLDLFDPLADREEVYKIYNTNPILKIDDHTYDVILVLVAHNQFKNFGLNKIKASCKKNHIIFDIKNLFKNNKLDFKL
jgi:UDP-N-acetyl-D-galactosamine dehydrogenase